MTLFGNINWNINTGTLPQNAANVAIDWIRTGVGPDGNIKLWFPLGSLTKILIPVNYKPHQLPDLFHLLGAIYSFYQSPLTDQYASKIRRKGQPLPVTIPI